MYLLKLYENIHLSVIFQSSTSLKNQGVTFLMVPPKDGFA
jgi:hypothetical protein